tara:strand:+ start:5447 stop:6562 length:1116 start_codon:yes stop_codon:yes gene_type:complete
MELSPEDSLRLNVLLANSPQAIRINESSMVVFGLSEQGEAKVQLNPNCNDEQYIKKVKELISGHVLGSPGGYPIYLRRWTRMGQMKDESLEQLLVLGEPEAIIAAVCAQGLTNELARRAWWAMEDSENARQMLTKEAVCNGSMGPVLADYLVEHLPFETEPEKQVETIRLVLQKGLLSEKKTLDLWRKAGRKTPYFIGFLATLPDSLPEKHDEHILLTDYGNQLQKLRGEGNLVAELLARVLSSNGQSWIQTLHKILRKPSNQDVINITFDEVANYFSQIRGFPVDNTIEELRNEAIKWLETDDVRQIIELDSLFKEPLIAIRVLSGLSYGVVRPIFKNTTAIGSLMRKKLSPVMEQISNHLESIAQEKLS